MNDSELKKLLIETCPVRPGQEARAWAALRDRLYANPVAERRGWLSAFTWGRVTAGLAVIAAVISAGIYVETRPEALLTADSNEPGIFATCFYSDTARAHVVWLNGLGSASNTPTYMDPTTVIRSASKTVLPTNPNTL